MEKEIFNKNSLDVARNIIGMHLNLLNGNQYQIAATKAYGGESIQTKNMEIYKPGTIMIFNLRGHLHTCVSTLNEYSQDYILIHSLVDLNGNLIKGAGKTSLELGLTMHAHEKDFKEFFNISGQTSNNIKQKKGDVKTCLGQFLL